MDKVAVTSTTYTTSSVQTLKLTRVFGPKVWVIGTSAASGVRDRLSKYLMKRYIEGEKDEHRLTVEGLSYLQNLYREIDSRSRGGLAFWPFRCFRRDARRIIFAFAFPTASDRADRSCGLKA
jgi:hypothetical protein